LEPVEASGAVGTEAGYESSIGGAASVGHGEGEVDQGNEVGGILGAIEADDRADGGDCQGRMISECAMLVARDLVLLLTSSSRKDDACMHIPAWLRVWLGLIVILP
jgi:hypothetical protein